ncbi:MAG: LruC domain-containing protein [Bacteroidia bacterium]|nr:LruC domain-containing protein [Bacteroidia bacterium]
MKRIVLSFILVVVALSAMAQPTWTSIASGDWSNPAIWATSGGASGAPSPYIGSNYVVRITNGNLVNAYALAIQLSSSASLIIDNGGSLRASSNSSFTMNSPSATFKIQNGSFEVFGTSYTTTYYSLYSGNILWEDAIVRVGGYMIMYPTSLLISNSCVSTAGRMHWQTVGTSSNYATITNTGLFAGSHTSGDLNLGNSFINADNLRLFTNNPGSIYLSGSTITGSIYSIYVANGQIYTSGFSGTPELGYWYASVTPNLSLFSGPRINSASIAYSQPCGPQLPPCDVMVTKLPSHPNPGVGQQISFLIKVVNNSPFLARSIRVQDLLPSGYEFLSINLQAGNWTNPYWNIGDLSPYQEVQAILYARVKSGGNYANTASLAPMGNYYTDPVTANNQSTATVNPQTTSDLQITKVVDNLYPVVNQNVTYTIQVKNNGPAAPANITVTDFLPSGLQYVSHTNSMGTFSTNIWTITGYQLNPGQTATLNLVARVLPTGSYINSATVQSELTDPNTSNNTASVSIYPQIADLALSITPSNLNPLYGENVTLDVQLTNNGPSTSNQANVNLVYYPGFQFVQATTQMGTFSGSTWSVGNLGANQTTSMSLILKVNSNTPQQITGSAGQQNFDPNGSNNYISILFQPTSAYDLAVQKTVDVANPYYDQVVTFTINALNTTPGTATGVVVTDLLPDGYTLINATPNAGTWEAPNWNIGSLPNGAWRTMLLTAKVLTTGSYANTATISGAQPDLNTANNSATASVSPRQTSDLEVQMEVSNTTPIVGSEISCTVRVINHGPHTALATRGPVTLHPGLQVISFNASGGNFLSPANYWEIGNMASGDEKTLSLQLKVNQGGTLPISPSFFCDNYDHNTSNNSKYIQIIPINAIDLKVEKTVNNANPDVGTNVVFTIKVFNLGNIQATNVVVEDQLPNGYQLVSVNVPYGSWNAPNWTLPAITPGMMFPMTITAKVLPTGQYNNTATASADQTDPNPSNNSATVAVIVVPLNGPTAVDDVATGIKNEVLSINALANDLPGDAPINPASVQLVAGTAPNPATQGSLTIDPATGLMTFTPVANFTGTVVTQYSINDMNSLAAQAQLTINIIEPLTNLYPATGPGTLAFEDLWPGKGDYDFNDLVIDYQFEMRGDLTNHVVNAVGTFTIKAFGAALENGFGFQLPATVDQTKLTVSGSRLTEGFIQLNSRGLEEGQDKATIIVFDNTFTQMQHPGIGIGVNTEPDAPYVEPVTIVINMNFEPGSTTLNDLNIGNFNPFLIVNKVRGHEIHLPNYLPTIKADASLFGKWEDASRPQQGKFYVTANNLPWGINLYQSFDYPKEKRDITQAYQKFVPWAVSGGVQFPDWYRNLPGYRNEQLIYQKRE